MSLESDRSRLLELLVKHAFAKKRIVLASGRESDFYVDCRAVALSAEGHALIGRLMLAKARELEPELAAVGGLTMGADPLASAVSLTSFFDGPPVGAFLIRKEPKDHGTGKVCEGLQLLPPNARAVILEDVVTTGGSSLKAVESARKEGLGISSIVALVDRDEGGRQNLEAAGLRVVSLFTRSDFPA